jgi:hypothetical protein
MSHAALILLCARRQPGKLRLGTGLRWPGVAAGKPSQHRRPDTIAGMSPNGTAQAGLVEVVNVAGGVDSRNPVEQQYLLTPVR